MAALAHAELASLAYLIEPKTCGGVSIERACETAGGDADLLCFVGEIASRSGELTLAARCWNRTLEADGGNWRDVADASSGVLSTDEILERVIPVERDTSRSGSPTGFIQIRRSSATIAVAISAGPRSDSP